MEDHKFSNGDISNFTDFKINYMKLDGIIILCSIFLYPHQYIYIYWMKYDSYHFKISLIIYFYSTLSVTFQSENRINIILSGHLFVMPPNQKVSKHVFL